MRELTSIAHTIRLSPNRLLIKIDKDSPANPPAQETIRSAVARPAQSIALKCSIGQPHYELLTAGPHLERSPMVVILL
jgi:hypothetical protein